MTKHSDRTWHYRPPRLMVPRGVIDQLKPDSPLHGALESPEHREWLASITDNVNRKLGHKVGGQS